MQKRYLELWHQMTSLKKDRLMYQMQ